MCKELALALRVVFATGTLPAYSQIVASLFEKTPIMQVHCEAGIGENEAVANNCLFLFN